MLNNINEGLLALSRDNAPDFEFLVKYKEICANLKCPPTDYLFYITNGEPDENKYNISAFFHNEEEQNEEMDLITSFRNDLKRQIEGLNFGE